MTAGFALSYPVLCAAQGLTVAAARSDLEWLRVRRLAGRWWALAPAGALVGTIVVISETSSAAHFFTYLALVAVPPLAAFASWWIVRGAGPRRALLVVPLFALAWATRDSLLGDATALALTALSCVALGALLAHNAPRRWLEIAIVVTACVDAVLVFSHELQAPNNLLDIARPGGGLPQLQRVEFGDALMGYGDLFLAGLLGGLLAADRARQARAAVMTAAFALCFGLLFFFVGTLPATVPVAAAMLASGWRRSGARGGGGVVAAPAPAGPQLGRGGGVQRQ